MEKIYLNGKKMLELENTHRYLKRKFMFDNYYGENLDALWDLLSERKDTIKVIIFNSEDILINQGSYGISLLKVFKDLENVELILR